MLVTDAKETLKVRVLYLIFYICYLVQFRKNKSKDVLTLLDFKNEINVINPAFATQLGFKVQKINVNVQKIDRFLLEIYGIIIAIFQVLDKLGRFQFF